jgi:hypothetical protein
MFAGLGILAGAVCVAGLMGVGSNPVAYVVFGGTFPVFAVWAIVFQVRADLRQLQGVSAEPS